MSVTADVWGWEEVTDFDAYVGVTKGGEIEDSLYISGSSVRTSLLICPGLSGLGTYRAGPADVVAEYEYYDDDVDDMVTDYANFEDSTSSAFHVRGKAKASLTASRSGRTVTLTARATYYNPQRDRYSAHRARSAKLQVKSGKTWKTLRTVDMKGGKATVKITAKKKAQYRLTFGATDSVAAATSPTVTR